MNYARYDHDPFDDAYAASRMTCLARHIRATRSRGNMSLRAYGVRLSMCMRTAMRL